MEQLTPWQAIILGIVEGVTEFLPISSTGHLILTAAWMGLDAPAERKAAVDALNIIVQGGAILAVLGLYYPRVVQMVRGGLGRDAEGLRLLRHLLISFLPAAVLGLLLDDLIEHHLFYPVPVVAALFLGGVAMLVIGPWQRRHLQLAQQPAEGPAGSGGGLADLTWRDALWIGLLQCVAMWPGTSRSMMTILAGMCVGLRPRQAAEYSFLLGLPTLGGACCLKLLKSFTGSGPDLWGLLGPGPVVLGILAAALSAALAVKWLVAYLGKHDFALFGWYRIALSLVILLALGQGWLTIAPQN